MEAADELDGACHCGTVRFKVRLSEGLASARRCNCSFCSMRGAVAVSAYLDDLRIVEGEEALSLYTFNTGEAKHYFCSKCGIYTHHQRRSVPTEYGVNAACLGFHPFSFAEVEVVDGQRHPKDGFKSRIAGVLKYEPRD